MNLGSKLKTLRKLHSLTLQSLSDKLNDEYKGSKFSKGRLSMWENGKDSPLLSSIKKLADFYNIRVDYFTSGNDNIEDFKLSSNQTADLNKYFSELSPKRQRAVIHYAKNEWNDQQNSNKAKE